MKHLPILLLFVGFTFSGLWFTIAGRHGQVGRFSVRENTEGAGNTPHVAIIKDWATKEEYPIYYLQWQLDGVPQQSIGVAAPQGGYCIALRLRDVSK